jgi:hypothetical protein
LEGLKRDFLEPPKTDAEVRGEGVAEEEGRKVEEAPVGGWMSRFKKVQSSSADSPVPAAVAASATPSTDGASDAKPPPFASGHGNDNSGVAGSTSATSSHANTPAPPSQPPRPAAPPSRGNFSLKNGVRGGSATASAPVPKRRMRAEDMFGDSDEE